MALEWKYRDHDYAPSSRCKVYPFFGSVLDMDGDLLSWDVCKHKEVIAKGTILFDEIPEAFESDFDYAQSVVEAEMKKHIEAHILKLETDANGLRESIKQIETS